MNKLKAMAAGAALVVTVTLAGCGSSGGGHDMGSTSSSAPSTAPTSSSAGTPAAGPHDDADVMFAQLMVPHHRQAIEMADMLLSKQDIDSDVITLAKQIKAAQTPEIDQMTGWLTGWGQSVSSMPMDHDMGGTMTQAEMDDLDRATGTEAAKLFLSGMVKHHQGAVDMAKAELTNGQNADAQELARSIEQTQQAEIDRMNQLLATY